MAVCAVRLHTHTRTRTDGGVRRRATLFTLCPLPLCSARPPTHHQRPRPTAQVDNRGSFRRGTAFERALSRRMGTVEVADQCAAVEWLIAAGLTERNRGVGCYGWSYGGYMSLMLLAQRPDLFCAAVAGAPVTDWAGYDTGYTERYMGTPAGNPEGYRASSVMSHVPHMRAQQSLLLVHGLIDENVHVRHTWRLIDELIKENKAHQLLVFPKERHMPREPAGKAYQEARIADFFAVALRHF